MCLPRPLHLLALAVWKRGSGNSHCIFRQRDGIIYLTAILPNILGHDDTEAVEGPGQPHGPHLQPGQGGGVKLVDGGVVFTGEGGEASCVNITKTTSTQCRHPPVRITLLLRVTALAPYLAVGSCPASCRTESPSTRSSVEAR